MFYEPTTNAWNCRLQIPVGSMGSMGSSKFRVFFRKVVRSWRKPAADVSSRSPDQQEETRKIFGRFSGGFWLFLQCKTHQISSNTIENPFPNSLKKLPICASIISNHWHPSKKRDEKQSRVPAIPRPKEPTSGTLHSEDSSIWQTDSATKTPIKQLKQSAISFWLTK